MFSNWELGIGNWKLAIANWQLPIVNGALVEKEERDKRDNLIFSFFPRTSSLKLQHPFVKSSLKQIRYRTPLNIR